MKYKKAPLAAAILAGVSLLGVGGKFATDNLSNPYNRPARSTETDPCYRRTPGSNWEITSAQGLAQCFNLAGDERSFFTAYCSQVGNAQSLLIRKNSDSQYEVVVKPADCSDLNF